MKRLRAFLTTLSVPASLFVSPAPASDADPPVNGAPLWGLTAYAAALIVLGLTAVARTRRPPQK